jgi:hypothetical protein
MASRICSRKLSINDLADFGHRLQRLNHERISFEAILEREHFYMSMNAGNIVDALREHFSPQSRARIKHARELRLNICAEVELAAATAAGIRYTIEEKTVLTNAESLVPKYLDSIPPDPFSNRPLLNLKTNNGPAFYSVGPNLRDDQGKSDDIAPIFRDPNAIRILFDRFLTR